MSNANKEIVRRFFEAALRGNRDVIVDELLDEGVVSHDPISPEPVRGRGAYIQEALEPYLAAFADLQLQFDDQIAEGDKVVTRFTATGRHVGELLGIAPTGKEVTMTGIDIHRIENGRIVEEWSSWDMMGLMRQLGAAREVQT